MVQSMNMDEFMSFNKDSEYNWSELSLVYDIKSEEQLNREIKSSFGKIDSFS